MPCSDSSVSHWLPAECCAVPVRWPHTPALTPGVRPAYRLGVDFSSVAILSGKDFRLPARHEYHQSIIQISPKKCTLPTPGASNLCSRSRAGHFGCGEGGEHRIATQIRRCRPRRWWMSHRPALRQSLVSQLACMRVFLGHMKKVTVPSFLFLPFAPHFTICNKFHVGENAARNESGAFSIFFDLFPLSVHFWRSFGLVRCSSRVSEQYYSS